jgi:hypothetical protein
LRAPGQGQQSGTQNGAGFIITERGDCLNTDAEDEGNDKHDTASNTSSSESNKGSGNDTVYEDEMSEDDEIRIDSAPAMTRILTVIANI